MKHRAKDYDTQTSGTAWEGELQWTSLTCLCKQSLFFTQVLIIIVPLSVYCFPMRLSIAFPHSICSCSSYGGVPERLNSLPALWESGQSMRKFCLPSFPASSQNTPNRVVRNFIRKKLFSLFSASTASVFRVLMAEGNMRTKQYFLHRLDFIVIACHRQWQKSRSSWWPVISSLLMAICLISIMGLSAISKETENSNSSTC